MITIYTDGSSIGNPGPGGWGAIISSQQPVASIKEIGGREEKTTNNRMEMVAAIEALGSVPEETEAEVHTDSTYLLNGITKWIFGWQQNGWRTKNKKEVLNKDLWQKLLKEVEKRKVAWKKVLGHSGHKLNDRCDEIANSFADGEKIPLYKGLKSNYEPFH